MESKHKVWIYAAIIIIASLGCVYGFTGIYSANVSALPPHPNVVLSASEQNYWMQDDYASCMNMSLEEYVENKDNSDWRTNYNRGILDHRMSQCATNNIPDDGLPNLKQHLPAYNECMDFYLEEYIENKDNSDWKIDYNRGILDWQIEYCGKDPYILNHLQS